VYGHLAGRKINKGVKMLDFKKFKHHYVLNMQERVLVCLFNQFTFTIINIFDASFWKKTPSICHMFSL
jgi:hypothetical protein